MAVRTQGFEETQALLRALSGFMLREGERALADGADNVASRAKENLEGGRTGPRRIDTGDLQRSIERDPVTRKGQAVAVEVGTDAEYAPHVHYGTDRMAANRFLAEAGEHEAPLIEARMIERIDTYLAGR